MALANTNITLSGALTTTSGTSPVTSSARTISGSGALLFDTITTDSGTPQYQHNGGAWASITEGMTLAVSHGDTIAVRASLPTVAQTASFDVRTNSSAALIESVTLTKS